MEKIQNLTRSDLNFFVNQNVQIDRSNLKHITLRISKNSKFINSAFEIPKYLS